MIRPLTINDQVMLQPLVLASQMCQKVELEGEDIDEAALVKDINTQLADHLNDPTYTYLGAFDGSRLVGYAQVDVSSVYKNNGSFGDIYVDPTLRQQKYGHQLMQAGLKWLKEQGAHEITLAIHQNNKAARALAESVGFSEEPDEYRYLKLTI